MMNDNNVDKMLEENFQQLEKDLYEQEVSETPITYWRFGAENTSLLTWSGLYKPRRS
jgi:hypothetical protein